MIYTLLEPKHPLLLSPLPVITADTEPEDRKEILDNMVETMKHYGGIGLSANQVGLALRMFVFGDNKHYVPCFNPRIISTSEKKVPIEEGCLTYPGLFVKIFRPDEVTLTFEDENRELHEETFTGLMARVVLHEMDHMNGIDFQTRAGKLSLDIAKRKRLRGTRKLKKMQEN
jgi:peptide deformylase|tara:strand:- start:237 stop:752 length:516 start_codon:yes stop_codon:yes gene_type:complete